MHSNTKPTDTSHMTQSIAIQVPVSDREDLTSLLSQTKQAGSAFEGRPFDGETAAQILVGLTTISLPFVKLWVGARVEARKKYKVIINGVEMTGYSAQEVRRLLEAIDEAAQIDPPKDNGS